MASGLSGSRRPLMASGLSGSRRPLMASGLSGSRRPLMASGLSGSRRPSPSFFPSVDPLTPPLALHFPLIFIIENKNLH